MIKVYKMSQCPDCISIEDQLSDSSKYEVIDIGASPLALKEFLVLRDGSPAFDKIRRKGVIGIPCFVLEDGTVTFRPEEAGITPESTKKASCSLDGSTGC